MRFCYAGRDLWRCLLVVQQLSSLVGNVESGKFFAITSNIYSVTSINIIHFHRKQQAAIFVMIPSEIFLGNSPRDVEHQAINHASHSQKYLQSHPSFRFLLSLKFHHIAPRYGTLTRSPPSRLGHNSISVSNSRLRNGLLVALSRGVHLLEHFLSSFPKRLEQLQHWRL